MASHNQRNQTYFIHKNTHTHTHIYLYLWGTNNRINLIAMNNIKWTFSHKQIIHPKDDPYRWNIKYFKSSILPLPVRLFSPSLTLTSKDGIWLSFNMNRWIDLHICVRIVVNRIGYLIISVDIKWLSRLSLFTSDERAFVNSNVLMEGLSLYAVEMLQQQERINGYIYIWRKNFMARKVNVNWSIMEESNK
jgi:hypothetical protein